ncbi:hypothetical protein NTE_00478 [Candidatus Nitrososphaera evergladensis SR1]|uniref:Uncharacterized protein n=1 Tax=Candidatus Nitrososphaera evergladensis SR1 TaxID=1459636 RepID=A0A075MTC5_9ARCH|nr:hypothetical protein NTE_00478 [Candidatus Nitrososphaera evergladensis SR1]
MLVLSRSISCSNDATTRLLFFMQARISLSLTTQYISYFVIIPTIFSKAIFGRICENFLRSWCTLNLGCHAANSRVICINYYILGT